MEVDDPGPAGSRAIYSYDADGKLTAVQDQNHTTANTINGYDELDRLVSVTQKSGPTSNIVTSYSYDPGDNLTSVTDPNGNTTQYVYDDFGLLVTQTSPVTGTTTYVYDAAGNLRTSTDANGTITNRTYDPLNRVLSSTSACTGDDTEVVTWSYDTGLPVDYSKGRLVGMDDPSGSTSYKYDRRGLVRLEEHVVSDPVLGVSDFSTPMSYDSDGNRTAIADVRYTYDFAARPATAAIVCSGCPTTTVVSSVSYLPFGPELTLQFGNGMHQSRQFDLRYREKQNLLTSGTSVTVARYDYTLDAVGNITDMLDSVDHTFDRHYSYDDLSRLVGSTTGTSLWGSAGFSYDAMGNLTVINSGTPRVQSFSYTGTTPKIGSPATTYDDVGNERVSDFMWSPGGSSTITRSYSCRNLMSKATISATSVPDENYTYTYDGRGVRVSGTSGSASGEQYVYTPELQLLRRRVIPSSGDDEFVWFNGRPAAQVTLSGQSGYSRLAYTLTDHLGSPLLQTDAAGNIIWRAEYEPYGRIYQMRTGVSAQQPLRLPGQEVALHGHDLESYNIFRWYRAGWGRYTQGDPLGLEGSGDNLYAYALENPISFYDSTGLTVNLRCRSIGNPKKKDWEDRVANLGGAQHCYLSVSCRAQGIDETIVSYLNGVTIVRATAANNNDAAWNQQGGYDNYPVGGNSGTCCNLEKCILSKARELQGRYMKSYGYGGPNSNSFANWLIRQCGGQSPPPRNVYKRYRGGPYGYVEWQDVQF